MVKSYAWICTRCNLLLMEVDSRSVVYERAVLDEGHYDYNGTHDYDGEHEYYLCPKCDGSDITEPGVTMTLEDREIPTKAVKELHKLWDDINAKDDEVNHHGIPLDNEELKIILVEGALTE